MDLSFGFARPLALLIGLGACGPAPGVDPTGSTGAAESTGASTASTGTTATLSSAGPASTGGELSTSDAPTTAAATTATADGTGFLARPDLGQPGECDPHAAKPCPDGQKCSAAAPEWAPYLLWAGRPACFPILGDLQKGEPCDLGEEPFDGLDECAPGLLCVDTVGYGVTTGVCTDFCDPPFNDSTNASCNDPLDFCLAPLCQECGLQVCALACDPLVQDCPDGTGCVLAQVNVAEDLAFACEEDWPDLPGIGEPCGSYYRCVPGVQCVQTTEVANPACQDPETCCTPLCDLNEPNTCPGAAMGEVCKPFYPAPFDPIEDPWSVQYDRLGICRLEP